MLYEQTPSYGGNGGGDFADDPGQFARLRKIVIRHGAWIDAIQGVWDVEGVPIESAQHGGNGGGASTIELAEGEMITRVAGRSGVYIDTLTFTTSHGRVFGPYGGGGGSPFPDIVAKDGIIGFYGRSGAYLDRVGFFLGKTEMES